MERPTIRAGLGREVVVIPEKITAIILDAEAEPMRFSDVKTTVIAERNRGRRGDPSHGMIGAGLERRTGFKGGRSFAGDAHKISVGLGLRTTGLIELRLSIGGKDELVGGDDTPSFDSVIDDADDTFLTLEFSDIPNGLAQGQVIGSSRMPDDLAAH